MYFKNYIALALLVPTMLCAEFTAQKDGISIIATVPGQGEQMLQASGISLKKEWFTARKHKPVWIEVTNSTDRSLELSNRSISAVQIDKAVLAKQYKYRAVLWPFLGWFGMWSLSRGIDLSILGHALTLCYKEGQKIGKNKEDFHNGINQKIQNIASKIDGFNDMNQEDKINALGNHPEYKALNEEVERIDATCTEEALKKLGEDMVEATMKKYDWLFKSNNIVRWAIFAAAIGSWWTLSSFNKELELFFNQQLLQDPIMVAPGQTIKKLVVLDGTTDTTRFALSIFDARTHLVKSQFEVVI